MDRDSGDIAQLLKAIARLLDGSGDGESRSLGKGLRKNGVGARGSNRGRPGQGQAGGGGLGRGDSDGGGLGGGGDCCAEFGVLPCRLLADFEAPYPAQNLGLRGESFYGFHSDLEAQDCGFAVLIYQQSGTVSGSDSLAGTFAETVLSDLSDLHAGLLQTSPDKAAQLAENVHYVVAVASTPPAFSDYSVAGSQFHGEKVEALAGSVAALLPAAVPAEHLSIIGVPTYLEPLKALAKEAGKTNVIPEGAPGEQVDEWFFAGPSDAFICICRRTSAPQGVLPCIVGTFNDLTWQTVGRNLAGIIFEGTGAPRWDCFATPWPVQQPAKDIGYLNQQLLLQASVTGVSIKGMSYAAYNNMAWAYTDQVDGGYNLFTWLVARKGASHLPMMAADGVNAVAIVVAGHTWTINSNDVLYPGKPGLDYDNPNTKEDYKLAHYNTASNEDLRSTIRLAKQCGMKVMLKPFVDSDDEEWRALYRPEPGLAWPAWQAWWETWFESYEEMLKHYAVIAIQEGVDWFCIGTELCSSASDEGNSFPNPTFFKDLWLQLISEVRSTFAVEIDSDAGLVEPKLLYAAYQEAADEPFDYETKEILGGYWNVNFWEDLDFVGIDLYVPFAPGSVSQPEDVAELGLDPCPCPEPCPVPEEGPVPGFEDDALVGDELTKMFEYAECAWNQKLDAVANKLKQKGLLDPANPDAPDNKKIVSNSFFASLVV